MLSRLQGKQNLWCGTLGHWTKCVSSRRSWQRVHLRVGAATGSAPADCATAPSDEVVTVVEETCLDPLDLLPDGPAESKYRLVKLSIASCLEFHERIYLFIRRVERKITGAVGAVLRASGSAALLDVGRGGRWAPAGRARVASRLGYWLRRRQIVRHRHQRCHWRWSTSRSLKKKNSTVSSKKRAARASMTSTSNDERKASYLMVIVLLLLLLLSVRSSLLAGRRRRWRRTRSGPQRRSAAAVRRHVGRRQGNRRTHVRSCERKKFLFSAVRKLYVHSSYVYKKEKIYGTHLSTSIDSRVPYVTDIKPNDFFTSA